MAKVDFPGAACVGERLCPPLLGRAGLDCKPEGKGEGYQASCESMPLTSEGKSTIPRRSDIGINQRNSWKKSLNGVTLQKLFSYQIC